MDLPICSACSCPTASAIVLKTCQHSFCVLCLKYALMYGGTPELQCPYPLGTFECRAKPNEAEVQYLLEYEEDQKILQGQDEAAGTTEAVAKLENSLDRILSIDADEFPGEPKEDLPSVKSMQLSEMNMRMNATEEDSYGGDDVFGNSKEEIISGQNQLINQSGVIEDYDLLQEMALEEFFNESNGALQNELMQSKCDEMNNVENQPNCNDESSSQIEQGMKSIPSDKSSTTSSGVAFDIVENAGCQASKATSPAKDVSKGAIPKVRMLTNQHDNVEPSDSSDNVIATPSAKSCNSEDQDLALALQLQEQESKIDLDLLLAISDANLPPNMESFECPVCYGEFKPYEGVTLTFCFHSFCRTCLAESVRHSDELEVRCPALFEGNQKCSAIIQDGAIRNLLTEEEFEKFQDRCLQTAEAVIPNTVHCLTPNCRGWFELVGPVPSFDCLICSIRNCVSCKAIHGGQSCEDYKANLQRKDDDIKSEATLKTMVETREAMRCPKCGVMITKIAGCDFMTCTTCKIGICWPTRGPRWGPAGQGDNSGGCRCKVDGNRCHPECEGCH